MEASASVLSWLRCMLKMDTLGTLCWVRMIHIRSGLAEGCWCVKGAQAGENKVQGASNPAAGQGHKTVTTKFNHMRFYYLQP